MQQNKVNKVDVEKQSVAYEGGKPLKTPQKVTESAKHKVEEQPLTPEEKKAKEESNARA